MISPQPAGYGYVNRAITFNSTLNDTWTVQKAGDYLLMVTTGHILFSLVPYYINITHSNGSLITKSVNVLRSNDLYKLIYLNATKDLTLTCNGTNSSFCSFGVRLMNTDPANFKLDGWVQPSTTTTSPTWDSTAKLYPALSAGYYALFLTGSQAGTFTSQSDPYTCPYDSTFYTDSWKIY